MKMQLAEIASALGLEAQPGYEQVMVTSVSFDSRSLTAGALFVPLTGEHDGHNYIEAAQANGAVATLWQQDHQGKRPQGIYTLEVADTLTALQQLAQYYLHKINPRVVAVTGSNGKTTTKDMTAAILQRGYNVQKTYANFNNQIGVPTTILGMEPNTEVLVVEMGMDHFGELDHLSRLVEPDVAVITMIGEAHIEFFGTRAKIADAKMEITHGLAEDGLLVYNGDEPLLRQRTQKLIQATTTFGLNDEDNLQATNVVSDSHQTAFRVLKWPEYDFTIPMIGAYNVNNALAALAVGDYFQIPVAEMQLALQDFALTKNRTEWVDGNQGERILSDVYNSNPTAVKEVLAAFENTVTPTGKRIVVLGDMLELGEQGPALHAGIAQAINPDAIASVYLCGPLMSNLRDALLAKMPATAIHYYDTNDKASLIADLKAEIAPDDLVLLKGSHGIHLETVLAALTESKE